MFKNILLASTFIFFVSQAHSSQCRYKGSLLSSQSRQKCLDIAEIVVDKSFTPISIDQFLEGPERKDQLENMKHINCRYLPRKKKGGSPKFRCFRTNGQYLLDEKDRVIEGAKRVASDEKTALDDNGNILYKKNGKPHKADKIRIKYHRGSKRHNEVFTEVMASRLLWTMGFATDIVYPTSVTCHGCRSNPHGSDQRDFRPSRKTTFNPASVERKYDGKEVELEQDQGWDFKEIYLNSFGQKRIDFESYLLALRVINYRNLKQSQNRLLCPKGSYDKKTGICSKSVIYVQDPGNSFGATHTKGERYNARGEFKKYSRHNERVFKYSTGCTLNYAHYGRKYFGDEMAASFTISEQARSFIAAKLSRISRQHLVELVRIAFHTDKFDTKYSDGEVNEWADVIESRINEIKNRTCL